MKTIYVDNAASTKVRQEVLDEMIKCNEHYGNPSCIHSMGIKSRELIDDARNKIAISINASPDEIIFTSGGTESNNLALKGFVDFNSDKGNHIITTKIEHMSVLSPLDNLRDLGCSITYLNVDSNGRIDLDQLKRSINRNTILISIMFANNEIGTIQPIDEIGIIAERYGICFHTDAIQAIGHCDIDVNKSNIDMLSMSGHKFYAPKGIGALYVRNGIELSPIAYGSGQEYGFRSGTENTNSIVGMGKAIELLDNAETEKLSAFKNKLIDGIQTKIQGVKLNGSTENSLHSIVNFSFDGIDGEILLMALNSKGIYVSSGSACSSTYYGPSHVLSAIGLSDDLAYNSLRFSLGIYNTENDVNYILDVLPGLVDKLRKEAL